MKKLSKTQKKQLWKLIQNKLDETAFMTKQIPMSRQMVFSWIKLGVNDILVKFIEEL